MPHIGTGRRGRFLEDAEEGSCRGGDDDLRVPVLMNFTASRAI